MNHLSRCAGVVVDLRVSTRRSLILCCLLCVDWELDHDRKTGTTRPPTFAARSLCLLTLLLAVAALTLISLTSRALWCSIGGPPRWRVVVVVESPPGASSSPCFVVDEVLCCFLHAVARRESTNAFSKGLPVFTPMQMGCLSVRYGHDVSGWRCVAILGLLCAQGGEVVVALDGPAFNAMMLH
jgi:hypothetical protein